MPYDPNYRVYTSWDLGLDDLTVVWFVQLIGREVRWIDYYESRNRSLIDSAREILSKRYVYAEHYGPHDIDTREQTSAKTRKQTLESVGLRPIRAGSQIGPAERIHALRNLLKISVFDAAKCAKGLEALRSYHAEWDDKAKTPKKNPKHDWSSHAADSAGEMAVQLYDSKAALSGRGRVGVSNYDPLRIGEPGYIERLNMRDDYDDRPWMRQETSGMDWDPLA